MSKINCGMSFLCCNLFWLNCFKLFLKSTGFSANITKEKKTKTVSNQELDNIMKQKIFNKEIIK